MLAISIERYILIVKATDSKTLLSTRRRRLLYGFAIAFGFIIPSVYVVDYVFVNIRKIEMDSEKTFQFVGYLLLVIIWYYTPKNSGWIF